MGATDVPRLKQTPRTSQALSEVWHLYWQAAIGRDFFPHPALYERVRQRLLDAHRPKERTLIDYCLLPGEIHLITELRGGQTIGEVARSIVHIVSRWVRIFVPTKSPLLSRPYGARLLESREEVLQQIRMLAWRPVRLGMFETPRDSNRGAYRIASGAAFGEGFDSRPLLSHFVGPAPAARRNLIAWVQEPPTEQEWQAWELSLGLRLASGEMGTGHLLVRELLGDGGLLVAASSTHDIDGAVRLLETWVRTCLKRRPMDGSDRLAGPRFEARVRAGVACLAVRYRLCSAAAVARHYGRSKGTLSEQMTAFRARSGSASLLNAPVQRILHEYALSRARDASPSAPCVTPRVPSCRER